MKHRRHHRWSTRLSLLAMVALLWTQLALASHPACTLASMAQAESGIVHANHGRQAPPPCHETPTVDTSSPACESHCSRSELSPDASRALAVPALGLLPAIPVVSVQRLPQEPDADQAPGPLRSWHRPTDHPASLLLI